MAIDVIAFFRIFRTREVNHQPQIKDYGMGLTAILFKVVIRGIYNNLKQTKQSPRTFAFAYLE
jgi:hypothetical protein